MANRLTSQLTPIVEDLDDVTWVAGDGLTYQRPELALAFKAAATRPKDDCDLDAVWPKLGADRRRWFAATVAGFQPGHPWLERLR